MLNAITRHGNTTEDILVVLMNNPACEETLKVDIAGNPNADQKILPILAVDESSKVRRVVAQHPNATVAILEDLVDDDMYVAQYAVAHPKATNKIRSIYSHRGSSSQVAENETEE